MDSLVGLRLDQITEAITIKTHLIGNLLAVKNRVEVTITKTTTIKVVAKKARKIRPKTPTKTKALIKARAMITNY